MENLPNLAYASARERRELLQEVLLKNEEAAGIEIGDDADNSIGRGGSLYKKARSKAMRGEGSLAGLAGGEDMAYMEYSTKAKDLKEHHPLIRKMYYKNLKR